ncbi:Ankyrin repeat-containing domain protein [Apiospora arundinis]|uniref:Ankyrin repeat-containing domain protein n=1 Tax=Apiospora arundinis TaxID=335852 RepID=A0ABR2HS82_9PEZI
MRAHLEGIGHLLLRSQLAAERSIRAPKMSLGSLPEELVLNIASFLRRGDFNILSRACRDFERILSHELYLNDRKGARKALRWGAENGFVGTIMKARQAGCNLNESSWQDFVIYSLENMIVRLQMSSVPRREALRFNENREGLWLRRTPLVHAIRNGHHDVARYLIDEGAELDGYTIGGTTRGRAWLQPIHHVILAAAEARVLDIETEAAPWQDLLLYILEKGVDPNTPGLVFEPGVLDEADAPSRAVTPLGMSLQAGCPWEITKTLLSHGADPTMRTGFSLWPETPYFQPFEQVWLQLVRSEEVELWKSTDGWSKKAAEDRIEKLCLLLGIIPNLNEVYVKEEPLLLLLASHVSSARAKLLEAVKSRDYQVKEGTAEPPIVRLISAMKADAKLGHLTRDQATEMQYAASAVEMLDTLRSLGADPNAATELPPLQQVTGRGWTPTPPAISAGRPCTASAW